MVQVLFSPNSCHTFGRFFGRKINGFRLKKGLKIEMAVGHGTNLTAAAGLIIWSPFLFQSVAPLPGIFTISLFHCFLPAASGMVKGRVKFRVSRSWRRRRRPCSSKTLRPFLGPPKSHFEYLKSSKNFKIPKKIQKFKKNSKF